MIGERLLTNNRYRQALNSGGNIHGCGVSTVLCNGYAYPVNDFKFQAIRDGELCFTGLGAKARNGEECEQNRGNYEDIYFGDRHFFTSDSKSI